MTAQELAGFLRVFVEESPDVYLTPSYLFYEPQPGGVAWLGPRPDVRELAQRLRQRLEANGIELGGWFNTPTGERISEAVSLVIAPEFKTEYTLFVDALSLAAKMQQGTAREQLAGKGLLVGAGALFLAMLFGSVRGQG